MTVTVQRGTIEGMDTEASAKALGPLTKMAAEVASISGVSYREALGSLLGASDLLARAWDQGFDEAATRLRPVRRQNPYKAAPSA